MSRVASIAAKLGKARRDGQEWRCLCPAHDDHEPSLSIVEKDGKLLFYCRAGCTQDAVIEHVRQRGAWPESKGRTIVATYDYRDVGRALRFQVVRFEPKTFRQRRPDGAGGWIWDMKGTSPLPYRLPELLQAMSGDKAAPIFIPEGEKDVDRLRGLGLVATCNAGGAGKFRKELATWLTGRDVILTPDNDPAGRQHIDDVARKLQGKAKTIRVLALPDLPEKGDVSDWLETGGTREELLKLAAAASAWAPGATPEPEGDGGGGGGGGSDTKESRKPGRGITLPEIEAAAEAVASGSALLDRLVDTIRRYVKVSEVQGAAIALWTVHAHAHDLRDFSPKLVVTSPQKRCGKTRLAEVIERLVPRSLLCSGIRPAALLRVIDVARPTLLIDELDALLGSSQELGEALRGLINSGFDRASARFLMTVASGKDHEVRPFSTWAPLLLAGIGRVPDTVLDRSVVIAMERKRKTDSVARLRRKDGADLQAVARQVARWVADNAEALGDIEPEAPPELNDRAQDAWDPLLAIAAVAGGSWPERARKAALALCGEAEAADEDLGTLLLTDLHALFYPPEGLEPQDSLSSAEICTSLAALGDRPWAEFGRARKPITQNALARLLKPYKVRPEKIREERSAPFNGYCRHDLDPIFERYLPHNGPSNWNSRNNSTKSNDYDQNQSGTRENGVPDGKAENASDFNDVPDEPVETPISRSSDDYVPGWDIPPLDDQAGQ